MRLIAFLCCFLIASMAAAKDLKIATVDVSKIVKEYPGYKVAQTKLGAMKDKKQSELVAEKKDLDELGAEIEQKKSVWSKKELKDQEYLYQKKGQDLYAEQSQAEKELAAEENEVLQKIVDEVKAIVAKTSKEKGVDLVLDAQSALYVKDGSDLTDDILKQYKNIDSSSVDSDSKGDSDSQK